jgi:Spx/MgsR family transcriptional regulator
MTDTRIYGLANCDTCRKARAWLTQNGIAHEFIDYRAHPLDAATLKAWAGKVGGWPKLVNRSSTTWRLLPEEQKSPSGDAQWLSLIASHPTLVKRPVLLTADGAVSVGFTENSYKLRFA